MIGAAQVIDPGWLGIAASALLMLALLGVALVALRHRLLAGT